jgi:hypothetical protein
MEFVDGGTLRPHIGELSLAQTAGVLESVLAGLVHAERHGVVHRDLKPENLMVTSDGRVKIADFGIAKATGALQTGSFQTETGTTFGTPAYIAPEQAMGEAVGPWTDLYSLGVITFEMLVGRTPFYDSDTPMSIVLRHINEPIPPVSELRPDLDPEVSDWVERLLVKDPSRRTHSAAEAWDEFEDLAIDVLGARWRDRSRLGGPPARTTGALPRTTGRMRTRTTRAAGVSRTVRAPQRETAMATRMPRRPAPVEPEPPQTRRRSPLAIVAVLTLLALVAGAAAFAGSGTGGGATSADATTAPANRATPAPTHASTATSPPPAPAPASTATPTDGTAAALNELRRSTARIEAKLTAASSARQQSQAADALATKYEDAANRLAGASQPEVVAALREIAAAYRTAAGAADRGDAKSFTAAGASVDAGRQTLDNALAGVPASAPATNGGNAPSGNASSGNQSSGGSGGSGGADENEPDENDNGD